MLRLPFVLLRLLAVSSWRLFVLLTPLVGVWLASSLVAFFGGWRELALAGGVLLFPLLPLLWEWRGQRAFARRCERARSRGRDEPTRVLTFTDRLVLRTLVVNLAFLGALLALNPKVAFTALATRGDWLLDGSEAPWAERARQGLVVAASGLEWLHRLANPNPYEKDGDDAPVPDDVTPTDEDRGRRIAKRDEPPKKDDPPKQDEPKQDDPKKDDPKKQDEALWRVGDTSWPWAERVHPVVAAMPAASETSIAAVASYIKAREKDPFQRVKALHDWVVTRLRYDDDSLVPGRRKPQDARSVFRNRLAVCEGYARLLVALGQATGDRVVYLLGEVREEDGRAAASPHAWNAVEIQGAWYLIDATWDDPVSADGEATYRTDYLFIPPSLAVLDHLPAHPKWQLLEQPLSRAAFLRQPMTGPGLARVGMTLIEPDRPLVDASRIVEIALDNPRGLHLMVNVAPEGARQGAKCEVAPLQGTVQRARCALPGTGRYEARIFANEERYGSYEWLASVGVNSR